MKSAVFLAAIFMIILVAGCVSPGPTEVSMEDNLTEFVLINAEGTIPDDVCSEMGLQDEIIMVESEYCGACRVAKPCLQELEQELGVNITYLDLSNPQDLEEAKAHKTLIQYTPTLFVDCEVYIGAYSKEDFKGAIENFLRSE